MSLPTVFIGSSSESFTIAKAIQEGLKDIADVKTWKEIGNFKLGENAIEAFERLEKTVDFAIFVLAPDDRTNVRSKRMWTPRDNVIYELGYFSGAIGRKRSIIVTSNKPKTKLPTDLQGITFTTYINRRDHKASLAVKNTCQVISKHIRNFGKRNKHTKISKSRLPRRHILDEDTSKFFQFFEKFYGQSGKLTIFCNNLTWLDNNKSTKIANALAVKAQSEELSLYLRNHGEDKVSQVLLEKGAKLYKVRESIRTQHRLSLLDSEGSHLLLLRDKSLETGKIVMLETSSRADPYIVNLTLDFLDDCYE